MLKSYSETAFYIDTTLVDAVVIYHWVKSVNNSATVHARARFGSYFHRVAAELYHEIDVDEAHVRRMYATLRQLGYG
jgi:hypothetical protein